MITSTTTAPATRPAQSVIDQVTTATSTDRPEVLSWLAFHGEPVTRAAVALNPNTSQAVLTELADDSDAAVALVARLLLGGEMPM